MYPRSIKVKGSTNSFGEKGPQSIELENHSLAKTKIAESRMQREVKGYDANTDPIRMQMTKLSQKTRGAFPKMKISKEVFIKGRIWT